MQLYAWAGQQAAALRQYQECRRILHEELGVEPEEAKQLLHACLTIAQAAGEPRSHLLAMTYLGLIAVTTGEYGAGGWRNLADVGHVGRKIVDARDGKWPLFHP
jgi:hypothetical protein